MNTLLKKIFLKKDQMEEANGYENDLMLQLMVEIAISDGNFDEEELKLMEDRAKKNGHENKDISLIIKKIINENKQSISFYPTIKRINEVYSINKKKELLQVLWELIAADSIIDPYEENLYFRIAELIKIKRSTANKFKQTSI